MASVICAAATICLRPLQVVTGTATRSFQVGGGRRACLMWVIVLHSYTKFEVHRLSRSEDMADFRSVTSLIGLVTLTF